MNNKICIGTAQFMANYGLPNNLNKKEKNFSNLIEYARKLKINYIDTAINYKNCHSLLGKIGVNDFKIITKIELKENFSEYQFLKSIEKSLNDLKVDNLYSILIHHQNKLINKKNVISFTKSLNKFFRVKKIGLSIYNEEELYYYLNLYNFDLVQVPLNLFNQTFIEKKLFQFKNIEFHARSVFLLGILIQNFNDLPEYFKQFQDHFSNYDKLIDKNKFKKYDACLTFVFNNKMIDKLVIGFDNLNQLKALLNFNKIKHRINYSKFASNDLDLIDPRRWLIE